MARGSRSPIALAVAQDRQLDAIGGHHPTLSILAQPALLICLGAVDEARVVVPLRGWKGRRPHPHPHPQEIKAEIKAELKAEKKKAAEASTSV